MKKLITALMVGLAGFVLAQAPVQLIDLQTGKSEDKVIVGVPTPAQVSGKLPITSITQTVTSDTNTIPANSAVKEALALKAGTTNALLDWTAVKNGTNYVYTEYWDATNNVKRFTRTP